MMSDWRDEILKYFVPGISMKTVVVDPDELFRDGGLIKAIGNRGFTLIYFEDPILFRFIYESKFRKAWDKGENKELVVIIKPGEVEHEKLPADLLQGAKTHSFFLKDILPNLSYNVVSKLEKFYFNALFKVHNQYAKQPLGEALTKEFILKHVFEIVPEIIKKDSDLLRMLLQRHYRKAHIPEMLDEYLLSILEKTESFKGWPLKLIVPNRTAFWEFLQERWPYFVALKIGLNGDSVVEQKALKYQAPFEIPFEHDDIRVYIDNLFSEGILEPIDTPHVTEEVSSWISVGLKGISTHQVNKRFQDTFHKIQESIPEKDANAPDWLSFSYSYAHLKYLWHEDIKSLQNEFNENYQKLIKQIGLKFQKWVFENYQGVYNYPVVSPVMVHHIPGYISHKISQHDTNKIAFLLIDGLALDQWLLIKDVLAKDAINISIDENALMAWVPTITPVSRQAAYSGKIPVYFPQTIARTDKDEYFWRQFWSNKGFKPDEISFLTIKGNPGDEEKLDEALSYQTRILGCTIFKIDKIMHGVQLGSLGMWSQVKAWLDQGVIEKIIKKLIDEDFIIYISSDHGNTETIGIGSPKEGVLSESKGERCRVYSDLNLRQKTKESFHDSFCWDHQGLPGNYHCLLAEQGLSFTEKGQTVVCHGGISIDEVIVPFIEIRPEKAIYK